MEIDTALGWAAERHSAVLITIRRDGRPQSSGIVYAVREGVINISVTADRAKTRNLMRENRAVVHMTAPDSWSYLSLDGTVELSPVAREPGDATCQALKELFIDVQGKDHPDWDEFDRAMVDEQRLVIHFTPTSAAGQLR